MLYSVLIFYLCLRVGISISMELNLAIIDPHHNVHPYQWSLSFRSPRYCIESPGVSNHQNPGWESFNNTKP
jgi:hypothetical protein